MIHRELERLAKKFVKERCEAFPHFGTYYGLSEYYPLLAYPSQARVASFVNLLRDLSQEVKAISEGLDEIDRIDQELLAFIFDYEIFRLQHPAYEASNVSPTYMTLYGVYDVLQLPRLSDQEKLAFVLARLEQSQVLFESLRQTWEDATLLALEETISQARQLEGILSAMLEPLMDGFQKKSTVEDLITTSGEKGKTFAQWLERDVKPRTALTCRVLGRENYERLLEIRREGHAWSERLRIGEKSLQESRERLLDLAPRLAPENGSIQAALSRVKDDLPQVPILEEARNAHQRVLAFLKDKHLLQVPATPFEIVAPPAWDPFWGEGMMGFTCAKVLGESPLLKLIVPPPATEKGKRELNRSFILLGIAHEGATGHLSSYLLRRERGRITRLLLPLGTGIDDRWTFYWEQLLREEGLEPGAAYPFYQAYRVFWCALRHVCDVKLHCELMSFEDCAGFLEREGDVSPITARMYTRAIAEMPGYFSSFIVGKEQLIELRAYVQAQLGARYAPGLFHRWVGEAGPIPYTLLEREVRERVKEVAISGRAKS
jgi:hypothetical protein